MIRKRKKPNWLTEKEFNCLENYIQYGNATRAAIDAGYSRRTASTQGSRLITSEKGRRYLDERMSKSDNEKIASADEILEYLTSVMRGEVRDQFDLDPSLTERTRAANELAKRILDADAQNVLGPQVTIINNIPKPKAK